MSNRQSASAVSPFAYGSGCSNFFCADMAYPALVRRVSAPGRHTMPDVSVAVPIHSGTSGIVHGSCNPSQVNLVPSPVLPSCTGLPITPYPIMHRTGMGSGGVDLHLCPPMFRDRTLPPCPTYDMPWQWTWLGWMPAFLKRIVARTVLPRWKYQG